jgi:hypothetical protein
VPGNLRDWVDEWVRLRPETFVERYSCPFLLVLEMRSKPASDPEEDTDLGFSTMSVGKSAMMKASPFELPVYPVQKRAGSNVFGMMITVGRASNNDIVIESPSVSKFQGFFEHRGGEWLFQDAESRNGTTIGSLKLTPRVPAPIANDSMLGFAHVRCRFLLPDRMHALLEKEAKRRALNRGEG